MSYLAKKIARTMITMAAATAAARLAGKAFDTVFNPKGTR